MSTARTTPAQKPRGRTRTSVFALLSLVWMLVSIGINFIRLILPEVLFWCHSTHIPKHILKELGRITLPEEPQASTSAEPEAIPEVTCLSLCSK